MEEALLQEFLEKAKTDYEEYGKDKDIKVWLKEAIQRLMPGVFTKDEEGTVINEILMGLDAYREEKTNQGINSDAKILELKNIGKTGVPDSMIEDIITDINEAADLIADDMEDMKNIVDSKEGGRK